MAEVYRSGVSCLFILHGNVHDLVHAPAPGADRPFLSLGDFLTTCMFGDWDIVLQYDLSGGLEPLAGESLDRLRTMVDALTARLGARVGWPSEPDAAMSALDVLITRNLLASGAEQPKRMAFLLPHAQYLVPDVDLRQLAGPAASRLVRVLGWAQDPYIKRINMAFCLIVDRLSELNDRLVQSPHVTTIALPLPDEHARRQFLEHAIRQRTASGGTAIEPDALARLSTGLDLASLDVVVAQASRPGQKLDGSGFASLKKDQIERQCQGLVEFITPNLNLDSVVGHAAARRRLQDDARWIGEGRWETAPMGYLICGPVGTGKTFLAECYAGSIGIPCVELKNFRSKYVGETEGNLEHVLEVLRSLGPVVVIVDEADAALGNRRSSGDSGTSSRVFSMIARQMSDTRYRGRLIWMLLTSRPDLLPIDLKRQGRAEVHIPLFYPHEAEELREMFRVLARKNRVALAEDAIPALATDRQLSGADIESIVLAARRRSMVADREAVTAEDLSDALAQFIPSAQGLEKQLQEIVAVLECTERDFLPIHWQTAIDAPDGRSRLQRKAQELQSLIDPRS